jgi:flavin-dependent dehydrogenase
MAAPAYDCAIIGGGLSGLALAILLARADKKVILYEKEIFPFHKVCGEYISNESIPFLSSLGIDLEKENLPKIDQLLLSSPSGVAIKRPLDIGGTGLSRYELDNRLYQIALAEGVDVRVKTKAEKINFANDIFAITAAGETIHAKTIAGAYGKNSNIDVQLGRKFKAAKESRLFIAVKHHIRFADFDRGFTEMHNFSGGYCGMSAIEDGKINMSYISKAANLKTAGSIAEMERTILSQNPHLKKYFDRAEFIFEKPLTISHLHFEIKSPVADHLLLLGDAAGNIAPLSGNGMSMALKSSKLAFAAINDHLDGKISREEMEKKYAADYYAAFSKRINIARKINGLFGKPFFTNLNFRFLKIFPGLIDVVSKRIHGEFF